MGSSVPGQSFSSTCISWNRNILLKCLVWLFLESVIGSVGMNYFVEDDLAGGFCIFVAHISENKIDANRDYCLPELVVIIVPYLNLSGGQINSLPTVQPSQLQSHRGIAVP